MDRTPHVCLHLGSLACPAPSLLDDPLEFLLVQQLRQRALCVCLRKIAARGSIPQSSADSIVAMMLVDLELYRADQDVDVIPHLRLRARVEDGLDDLLADLRKQAGNLKRIRGDVVRTLTSAAGQDLVRIGPREATMITSFAAMLQRQLAAEHGILLVLARKRLSDADLLVMSRAMKRRRGLAPAVP